MEHPLVSVVIRTYNEARHLRQLLEAIAAQDSEVFSAEAVLVDSGSDDSTLEIAAAHGCRIVHISREEFTFGRSLNLGCEHARGQYLVFVSGHCIPARRDWIARLVEPLAHGAAAYSYGRQIGNGESKFSECQLFRKYYPDTSRIPQEGFFCNNANAAIPRSVWAEHRFCEDITGLEDMDLGRRLHESGLKLAYVSEAPVYHLHAESWGQVKRRYEREAIALQKIMPQVHVSFTDFLRYFSSAVLLDMGAALQEKKLLSLFTEIIAFRFMQFWGSYCGNNEHRRISREMKERYFYPRY